MLSNLPSPTSSFSRPPVKSDLSRRASVSLYDPPVPRFEPDPDTTPSPIPTPPLSAHDVTAQWSQRRESLPPAPLTPTEPATPKSSQNLPYSLNGPRERKTGPNKLQKGTRPVSPPQRESMKVAAKSVDKRLSGQLGTPTHTPAIRTSFDTTSMPAQTSVQPPIEPLPASNSFYGAMPTKIVVPNAQLLSPVSPSPGPPRTQSQPHVETVNRVQQYPPAPKRADTDPIALPPANPEPLPTWPAGAPGQSQRDTSAINSPAPAPALGPVPGPKPGPKPEPEPEPANAVDVDPTPSRQSSAHNSARSASTTPSQVLKTPPDLAQEEEEQCKSPPESKSSTTLVRTPNRVDEDVDMPARSGLAIKTKRKDVHSHASRSSQSSYEHEHEHRHGEEKETGEGVLASSASKKNDIVKALVKRGERSQKGDGSDTPTSTADPGTPLSTTRAASPQPPSQQPPVQQSPAQQPPSTTPTPSPPPFRAPPSAARTLLPMYIPSRRRQASSPISKGEVEAARALGVVLFYPLEKHVNNPGLLEELLAYLSFHEFMTLSSTSKRIRTMLEDRKELRETVLERFLTTVGYKQWGFEIKEPLELSLKVSVRPQFEKVVSYAKKNFLLFTRISIPTSEVWPSRSTDMLKSPRRRR